MQNNMRDRLIGVLYKTIAVENEDTDDYVERLADELLANGVIIPPCKVGDTVYMICWDDGIEPFIEEDKIIKVSTQKFWLKYCYFNYDDIGKTVFLTREEAKAALKEDKEQ